jgi:hypothetical protein
MQNPVDWVTNPTTAISYGNTLIGKTGGITLRAAAPSFTGGPGNVTTGVIPANNPRIAQALASHGMAKSGAIVTVGKEGLTHSNLRAIKAVESKTSAAATTSIAAKTNIVVKAAGQGKD